MKMKSGFERSFAANLSGRKIKWTYETKQFPYIRKHTYNPDFILPDYPFIIECKGFLDRESKAKMIAVKQQYPELDIRFVFMNAEKRLPGSKMTHGEWASRHGFLWSEGTAPEEWFNE